MRLKVFTQPACPACPLAKELAKKLEEKLSVEYYDVSEPDGFGEATYHQVMTTPTLVLVDDKEKVRKIWAGTPTEKEVLKEISK